MDWTRHVDGYCERIDPGFWAEPVNALTNAVFLIAALVVALRLRGEKTRLGWSLVILLSLIGIGSFLFHTFAQPWAGAADVIPIIAFILVYIFAASRDFLGLGWLPSLLIVIAFLPISAFLMPVFRAVPLYGVSAGYLSVPMLIALYAWLLRSQPALSRGLAIGVGILMISLTFRSLDMPACDALPLGTHFLWHILNAIMLGWMIEIYRRHGLAPPSTQG